MHLVISGIWLLLLVLVQPCAALASSSCLTGTDPIVGDDPAQIVDARMQIDAACPCQTFDGSAGAAHGDYVKCAKQVLLAASSAGQLRAPCVGTVKRYAARATCGSPAAANAATCIKKKLASGKVSCVPLALTGSDGLTPTNACVGKPGKFDRIACNGLTHCIDAADTNGDLLISGPGDSGACAACTSGSQCSTEICADQQCCDESCEGICRSCAAAGLEGTCVSLQGSDPDEECGALSCSGFFAGFSGDSCFRRANASAAEVVCGSGSCETASAVCPNQPAGTVQVVCNSLCQDPNPSTCVNTLPGACTNVSQGNETCGTGACQVTSPRCVSGSPNPCVPGTPSAEACDGIDNDCDGVVDNACV